MSQPRRRAWWGVVSASAAAAAVMVMVLTGAFDSGAATPAGAPILIGSINDITGFAATFGLPERDGQRLGVKAINDAGGIKGRPLQLVERDTQGDANRAVQYFEELASDPKVAAIVGFTTSNDANAAKGLANSLKTPMFAFAGAPSFLEGDVSYLYRMILADTYLVEGILKFMKEEKGAKTFALLMQNDAFGQGAAKVAEKVHARLGFTLVGSELFGARDTDVTPQLTRIKTKKPDFILSYATGLVSAVINKNREALGMLGTPIIGPQNWGDSAVLQASGAAAEGVLVASSLAGSDPKPGEQTVIFNLYHELSGKPLHSGAMWGWDSIHILAGALGKVASETGNVDRVKLKAALDQTDLKGATGTFKFSDKTHELVDPSDAVMGIVEAGKWIRYASRKK
jgi:branched-chain amino acid transport system substrate-binding protein